jgi:hypothetical protein
MPRIGDSDVSLDSKRQGGPMPYDVCPYCRGGSSRLYQEVAMRILRAAAASRVPTRSSLSPVVIVASVVCTWAARSASADCDVVPATRLLWSYPADTQTNVPTNADLWATGIVAAPKVHGQELESNGFGAGISVNSHLTLDTKWFGVSSPRPRARALQPLHPLSFRFRSRPGHSRAL